MESNKENNDKRRFKSKIPLPNTQQLTEIDKRCPLKIDTRDVTIRKTEESNWNYKVFKDKITFTSTVISEPGPSTDQNKLIDNINKSKKITPLKSSHLDVNRIKNIKRSLKRPRSRELQGISPIVKQSEAEGSFRRRLNFPEAAEMKLPSPDTLNNTHLSCLVQDYVVDMFGYLLVIEKRSPRPIRSIQRARVLNWLIKISGTTDSPAVVQSAAWYLDAFLARSLMHIKRLQLVAAACYWISHKSCGHKSRPGVAARKLVRCSSHAFNVGELVCMEKSILTKLKFPKTPVVAQDFIPYLCRCAGSTYPGLEEAATFLCMSSLVVDRALCLEYPSVVAAAAVSNALLLLGQTNALASLRQDSVYQVAVKKAADFGTVCAAQRKVVCAVASPLCKYRAALKQHSTPPHYVAHKIVAAAALYLQTEVKSGR